MLFLQGEFKKRHPPIQSHYCAYPANLQTSIYYCIFNYSCLMQTNWFLIIRQPILTLRQASTAFRWEGAESDDTSVFSSKARVVYYCKASCRFLVNPLFKPGESKPFCFILFALAYCLHRHGYPDTVMPAENTPFNTSILEVIAPPADGCWFRPLPMPAESGTLRVPFVVKANRLFSPTRLKNTSRPWKEGTKMKIKSSIVFCAFLL